MSESTTRIESGPTSTSPAEPPRLTGSRGGAGTRRAVAVIGLILAVVCVSEGALYSLGKIGSHRGNAVAASADPAMPISITADVAAVQVVEGDVDRPRVEYEYGWGPGNPTFSERMAGSTWAIALSRSGWWQWAVPSGATLRLTVPRATGTTRRAMAITSSVGSVAVAGALKDLHVEVTTGSVEFSGRAETVSFRATTGRVTIAGAEVTEALAASTSTGSIEVTLSGRPPQKTTLLASTGSIEAILPAGRYAVHASTSTGSVRDDLVHDDTAGALVEARTSTGSVELGSS